MPLIVPDTFGLRDTETEAVQYFSLSELPPENERPSRLTYFFPASDQERADDFPWLRSDPNHYDDQLCDLCRQVDFVYLFRHGCPFNIYIKTYQEAMKGECSFCGLVMTQCLKVPALRLQNYEDSDILELSTFKPGESFTAWITRNKLFGRNLSCSIGFAELCQGIESFDAEDANAMPGSATPETGGEDAMSAQGLMPPRDTRQPIVRARYDPLIVKKWISDCTTCHPVEQVEPSHVQRLIDTNRECVVETAALKGPVTYAALSYVWGSNPQQVILRKSNYDALHLPGSLSTSSGAISATIRDAIAVCRDVGIPYLWVDALCITQVGDDKMAQINNMHRVYEGAIVTIVAAHGDSANAGLRGVSSTDDRQVQLRLQEMILFCKGATLDEILGHTQWSKRAWTYQEFLLSKRRLIFTKNLIYFACEHNILSEDLSLVPHVASGRAGRSSLNISGFDLDFKRELNWTSFASLVHQYTSKKLTNPQDVIPAFTALVEFMKLDMYRTSPFVSGVPFASLDAALLWRRCWGCEICSNSSNGLKRRLAPSGDNEAQVPSWSWAGWEGHVKYSDWMLCHKNPAMVLIPRVRWLQGIFLHKDIVCQVRSENPGPIETWVLPRATTDAASKLTKKGEWTVGGDNSTRLFSQPLDLFDFTGKAVCCPSSGFLLMEADITTFVLGGRLYNFKHPKEVDDYLDPRGQQGNPLSGIATAAELGHPLSIFDPRTRHRCGVLYDDVNLVTHGITFPIKCDFIKLSQTTIGEGSQYDDSLEEFLGEDWGQIRTGPGRAEKGSERPKNKDAVDNLRNFFDYNKYDCSRKWCVYNVLMVEWQGNVARRIGIGKVHVDAFDQSTEFRTKTVYLG
jgi:hypothetical protein